LTGSDPNKTAGSFAGLEINLFWRNGQFVFKLAAPNLDFTKVRDVNPLKDIV